LIRTPEESKCYRDREFLAAYRLDYYNNHISIIITNFFGDQIEWFGLDAMQQDLGNRSFYHSSKKLLIENGIVKKGDDYNLELHLPDQLNEDGTTSILDQLYIIPSHTMTDIREMIFRHKIIDTGNEKMNYDKNQIVIVIDFNDDEEDNNMVKRLRKHYQQMHYL